MKDAKLVITKKNPDADIIINALIVAGQNFFTTLAGLGAAGLLSDVKAGMLGAGISAGLAFFGSLAIQRGLKKGG